MDINFVFPALIALAWTAFWAMFDILIVEYIFRPLNAWPHIDTYHKATWWFLFPVLTLLAFWVSFTTLFIFVMFLAGWEDILYFWFQRKRVPKDLPWLAPWSPRAELLYMRAALGLAVILAVGWFL